MYNWFQLNSLGILAALVVALLLLRRYRTAHRHSRLPLYGTAGAVILIGSQYLTLLGVNVVSVYFTPIAWTGYILWVDGAVYALRGSSLLRNEPAEFAWLAACSIPLWLIFEAYNLRLDNWIYLGLPHALPARLLGYGWAFATIWPGIFETSILLRALNSQSPACDPPRSPNTKPSRPALALTACAGAALLVMPLILSRRIGAYLFGGVWLGFILLLEPLNLRAGRQSLWRDVLSGDSSRLGSLLWAGLICGIFWEFWNYWAAARWFYTVPILQKYKIFAMPLPGYLGFPPFAVECFSMFAMIAPALGWITRKLGGSQETHWRALEL